MTQVAPNTVYIGLANIFKPLSVLSAENKVYEAGRLIFAVDDSGNIGQKVGTWDFENVDISAGTKFNDLSWIVSPEQAGSGRLNVFSVKNTDPSYNNTSGSVVITDSRLIGKVDYIVQCTQFGGGVFRPDQVTYNAIDGKVTISFDALQDDELIWITIPMGLSADPDYSALTAQIEQLQIMMAPFMPAGGQPGKAKLWWPASAGDIPEGWQECVGMRGMLPYGIDPADADFNKTAGQTIGDKNLTITSTDQLPRFRLFTVVNQSLSSTQLPSALGRAVSNVRSIILSYLKTSSGGPESYALCGSDANNVEPTLSPTSYMGKQAPDSLKNLPRGIAGRWIEFAGITS